MRHSLILALALVVGASGQERTNDHSPASRRDSKRSAMPNGEAYYAGVPLRLREGPQLLIDDSLVEDRWRLKRVVIQPQKFPKNPVLVRDKAWEGDAVLGAKVIYDEERGLFRMWYETFSYTEALQSGTATAVVCYAESRDGYNWEKPLFDFFPFPGHPRTNILYRGTYYDQDPRRYGAVACQVWKDLAETNPQRRYKMLSYEPKPVAGVLRRGVNLATSPDGLRWRLDERPPLLDYNSDASNHTVYDPVFGRWLFYCRPRLVHATGLTPQDPQPGGYPGTRHYSRRLAVMTSTDFMNWSYPRTCLYPDEADAPDFNGFWVFRYGSHFIALLGIMDGDQDQAPQDVRLATSIDGLQWQRSPIREPYIPRGRDGDWDAGLVDVMTTPIIQGDDILIFYNGNTVNKSWVTQTGIGVAFAKADRFIEQRADDEPGFLITREFILDGNRLTINSSRFKLRNKTQYIKAEIVRHPPVGGHYGFKAAYEGFSFKDCDPVTQNGSNVTLTWRGKSDLSVLTGKPIYIRFELRNMGIFSFRVAKE